MFEFLSKLDSTEKERQAKEAHSRLLLQEEIESMMVQQFTDIVVRMETFQSHTDFAADIIASTAVTMKRWTDIYGKDLMSRCCMETSLLLLIVDFHLFYDSSITSYDW